ncbi:amidophosphoribosyltransferase [bacterium]|nr:MAG: amidophosphoribosyltransferase [bacterium]
MIENDRNLGEKCGVFGIYGPGLDVSRLTFFGLALLQHRGQESSGIAVTDGTEIDCHKDEGLVNKVYNERIIKSMRGFAAIGHNRYSTSGGSFAHHAQPIVVNNQIALAHNGNLPSVTALTNFLKEAGQDTSGCSDSELMALAVSHQLNSGKSFPEAIQAVWPLFTGAFSVTGLTKKSLFAFRDHCGIRPLVIGKVDQAYVVASETCAFNIIGAKFVREVVPGELVIINSQGLHSFQIQKPDPKVDIFEFVYFARPDSVINGKSVYAVRSNSGIELAKEFPLDVDLVVPVPETAIPTATSYARALNLPFEMALVKNRYVHRTFIQPDEHTRSLGVRMKLSPLPDLLVGKKVAIIDDSIVRGTTSKELVKALFEAGSKEVHMLVSSPPVKFPDFYGIDTPSSKKLIAVGRTVEEVRQHIGATSLNYLSLQGLIKATGLEESELCLSCFTGDYPIDLHERMADIIQIKAAVK